MSLAPQSLDRNALSRQRCFISRGGRLEKPYPGGNWFIHFGGMPEGVKSGVITLRRSGHVPVLAELQLDGAVCKVRHFGCEEDTVNNIIWWVGAIVIVLAILGYLGFR
ncbi:hypothetical protein SAMN02990966_04688 [Rhodospirillales bacterium URHD0017]|nr:hypothetical protein SAMN02990966_04688 [Rhodospirillales bacterium URHD0017]